MDDVLVVLYCLTLLAIIAFGTVIPWLIGLGWMAHHWLGV